MLLLSLLAGCWSPPPWLASRALDYHIDRPRVVTVTVLPERPNPLDEVTVDALWFTPPGTSGSVAVETCGVTTAHPTIQYDMTCFESDDVQHIADAVPATWTSPDFTLLPCLHTPWGFSFVTDTADTAAPVTRCHAIAPFVVTVTDSDGQVGAGAVFTELSLREDPPREPSGLGDAERSLTVQGEPAPGAEVTLRFEIAHEARSFSWYVDGGVLRHTGRTTVQDVADGRYTTTNVLEIPDDWEGPLRVAVVVSSIRNDPASAWVALEVTR